MFKFNIKNVNGEIAQLSNHIIGYFYAFYHKLTRNYSTISSGTSVFRVKLNDSFSQA